MGGAADRVFPRYPALSARHPLPIAHRGGAWESIENSMAAFRNAYDQGFRYFETDTRATSDGVAVAFHDARLDRTTGDEGLVRDTPWRHVRSLRVYGMAEILRLDDLLMAFPDVTFNVDVKERAAIGPFIEVLRRTRAWDRVVVASFSHRRLAAVRAKVGPGLATSLSPPEILGLRLASRGRCGWLLPRWAACAQVPERFLGETLVDQPLVRYAHRLGLQVHVWTVDDPDAMHRLLDLGVDGIMTDRPRVLKQVLQARGQWE